MWMSGAASQAADTEIAADGHEPEPLLLDARRAAAVLSVKVSWLRAATASGQIACVRLRGRGTGARDGIRWLREDLKAWQEAHHVPAVEAGQAQLTVVPRQRGPRTPAMPPRAAGTRGKATPLLSAREAIRAGRSSA
jgi:hypothetical protein